MDSLDFDEHYKVLHNKFDFDTHNKTFISYCEVVILEDGTIEYAVPSHDQKLIRVFCEKFNITYDAFLSMLATKKANDKYFEICSCLTKCMLVSTNGCRFAFIPNEKQEASFMQLVQHDCVGYSALSEYDANIRAINMSYKSEYWQEYVKPVIEHFFD